MRTHSPPKPTIEESLIQAYGVVMTAGEVATVLKPPSRHALNTARARGAVALTPLELKSRREHMYSTADVAQVLTAWLAGSKENAM